MTDRQTDRQGDYYKGLLSKWFPENVGLTVKTELVIISMTLIDRSDIFKFFLSDTSICYITIKRPDSLTSQ